MARKPAADTTKGRRSDDWQALVVTGDAGLAELCARVRALWRQGGDAYLDGRITFRETARAKGEGERGERVAEPQQLERW